MVYVYSMLVSFSSGGTMKVRFSPTMMRNPEGQPSSPEEKIELSPSEARDRINARMREVFEDDGTDIDPDNQVRVVK
jgi:hypothetical protein